MGAAAALSLIPIAHAAPPDIGEEWRLTFESEFERPTNAADRPQFLIEDFDRFARGSDNAKWEYRKGPNKDAYAVEENAFVSLDEETGASVLVLRTSIDPASRQRKSNRMRTGYIRTRNYRNTGQGNETTFAQRFGYFEARMKFDPSPGQWGAFWLMPSYDIWCADDSGRDATEIDIVEGFPIPAGGSSNRDKGVSFAIHYDGYGRFHKKEFSEFPRPQDLDQFPNFSSTEFVTYGFLWTPDSYTWYVNGIPTFHIDDPDQISQRSKYLKLSTEVQSWAGALDPERLPADTVIDWVRVWQTDRLANGNPYIFQAESDTLQRSRGVRELREETGTWCRNRVVRATFRSQGEITIPISEPIHARQIGIRISNKTDKNSSVSIALDGADLQTWTDIDLDPLFVLKHDFDDTISNSITVKWTGDVAIDQVYLVPKQPFVSKQSLFSDDQKSAALNP
ncbi:MAG: glycoside hydrolase family 16 protein [Pseudomonadota bacterium]